jgi:Tfp pilus assembly protein PilF
MTCGRLPIALFSTWILLLASFCTAGEEVWTEVTSPNFIVISNASPRQAQKTAKSFEQFRLVLKNTLRNLNVDPGAPLTVFAAKDEKTMNTLLAEERREKGAAKKAGIFVPGQERNIVALSTESPGEQSFHVIYHEYVHMLMRLNLGEIPLWLSEGLAEFFAYATLSDGSSVLGQPGPESLDILRTQSMIPLTTLLPVTHDSPYYLEQEKAPIFYAQSWALTHYLMIGDKLAHNKQLIKFLSLIQQGTSGEAATTQAFGDLKELEKAVFKYVHSLAFYTYKVPIQLDINENQYKVRTLSPAESLASRGELLVYLNKPDRAKALLDQSLQIEPRGARANEAMGHLYVNLRNMETAQKHFAAAAESNSESFLAHFYVGQSMLLQGSSEDMAPAETHLRKAITINPKFAPAYRQLSYILQKQMRFDEALELGQKTVQLEPGVLEHSLNVAAIMASMGNIDEAEARAKQIFALARTDADRNQAESFLNSIRTYREQQQGNQRRRETRGQAEARIRNVQSILEQQERDEAQDAENLRIYEENEKKQKAAAELRSRLKPGPPAKFLGIIKSVSCDYPATMEIVIESRGKQYKLHAENYYKVAFGAVGKAPRTNFNPCSELGGKKVEIEFLTIDDLDLSGFIQSITIME